MEWKVKHQKQANLDPNRILDILHVDGVDSTNILAQMLYRVTREDQVRNNLFFQIHYSGDLAEDYPQDTL